ncbi:MAG: T9SS type A sorting domain-containing protein, partial [Bacteroidales bacterium]|nr:T9SS type A sorting domain-containing protein [Bacteroidales bacterium]
WYTGQGFPSYQIHWEQTGDTLTLQIDQTQSHPSVSFFQLPLPIRVKNSEADTSLRLENSFSGEVFNIIIPFQADSVLFDPDLWLITANNSVIGAIHENKGRHEITVMPNPVHGILTVQFSKPFKFMKIEMLDETGKVILEKEASGMRSVSLKLEGISRGNYVLRFLSGKSATVKKIVVL